MAKAIAHITGTALRPGVSKNKRWYKPEHIAGMVASAQRRIGEGRKPMVMLSFHGAEDNSREITAALTSMTLEDDGSAGFTADIIGTEAGRDIATLVDSTDGKPALSTVSIRGMWTGRVRKERGPDGQMVETADGLELEGVDFTKSPGVEGAEIKAFSWATGDQTETTERVLITESVQEAQVTISEGVTLEGAPEVTDGVREALALFIGAPLTEADSATPAISKRGSGTTGSGRVWADPGYQADKKQRYDITTKAKALTAWRYIHQEGKASKYSGTQLKRIRSRIEAALKKFGVKVSTKDESAPGWVFDDPCQVAESVTDAVAEWYGESPKRSGSWSVSASNGPVNLNLSSYSMDPADLDVILRAAAAAACDALKALDPDMDGDVDVPGAGDSDTDDDGGHETAPEDDDPATETEPAAAGEDPAPAGTQETEDPAMAEETHTKAGGDAPAGLTAQGIAEAVATAVTSAFTARDEAKEAREKARKEAKAREAAEKAARKAALTEALAELGIKIPAPATEGGGTTESGATEGDGNGKAPLTEADVEKAVQEALTEFVQGLHTSGAILPQRAGLVVKEHAVPDADNAPTPEELRGKSDDDFLNHLGGALAAQADAHRPVG